MVFRSQVPKILSGGNFGSARFEKSSGWAGAMPGPPLKQPPGRHGWGHRRANSVGEHMRVS